MIITKENSAKDFQKHAGGKGYNLHLLTKAGFFVPPWIIIGNEVFKDFLNSGNLYSKIDKELKTIGAKVDILILKSISQHIQNLIISTPTPPRVEDEIKKAYRILNSPLIAIRSSAIGEDSKQYSFAGQFESYLGIKSESEALLMIKKCWASAFSDRSLFYRRSNNIEFSGETVGMAVIFQEMIEGDRSGVMFTDDPLSNDSTKVVVNSVYGLGIGVVSDTVEADHYVIDKKSKKVVERRIVDKTNKFTYSLKSNSIKEESVSKKEQNVSSLSDFEVSHLTELGLKIETFYNCPQDIEWTIKGKNFYILQSRPITTTSKITPKGTINIWDNSNIVESYGGLTLPLTFTFARYVYHRVYVQFCEVLMVPRKNIQKMDHFLANMLGIFYGRIYYNLINWYRLTSILPGFKHNSSFMETMMGTRQSLQKEIADSIQPFQSKNKFYASILKIIVGCKFLYYHFVIQKKVDDFLRYFNKVYQEYRKIDYLGLEPDRTLAKYKEIELKLLYHWKAPIINDFLCMVHFGVLKKLTGKWLPQLDNSIHNDLLCGQGNIESTAPTQQLINMANVARTDKQLKHLLLTTPAEKCMETIMQSDFAPFRNLIDQYIDQYGFRCMNEMKLEQKDLHQDPTFLFMCLKNYLRENQLNFEKYLDKEDQIREEAEKRVREHLSGIKRSIYFWSLKHARRAVRNRENTRFCRTKIYGVVRSMFFSIGKHYTKHSIIEKPEDIFYLELDELLGTIDGTLTTQNLKNLIVLRKTEYRRYTTVDLPNRFVTQGPVYWNNEYVDTQSNAKDVSNSQLNGIGCSPGIVEKTVKIIISPNNNTRLNGEILVTQRTDPGWIPLYPSISGLLVERGSLLSHSAIVAREMGIPTVVGIPNLTKIIKNGMRVRMDGKSGTVQILES